MFATPEGTILSEVDAQFNRLKEFVFGPAQKQALHEVEGGIFRQLLVLGLVLLKLYLQRRGIGRVGAVVRGPNGDDLGYHGVKERTYFSIFGKLPIARAYYWREGAEEGVCPLDKALNLPEGIYSYLLQDWAQRLGVQGAFDKGVELLRRMLRIDLWKSPVEAMVRETSEDVGAYYEEKRPPAPSTEGEILVVTADGKGVPMKRKPGTPRKKRLSKGDKRSKKKMTTVTAVYTVDRKMRSADDIVQEMRKPSEKASPQPEAPTEETSRPKNKRVLATFQTERVAVREARAQVEKRDPKGKRPLVGLTDGDTSLQYWMKKVFRGLGLILILDLYHAMEYLWKAAHVFHREGSAQAEAWVTERLRWLLTGKLGKLLRELTDSLTDRKLSPAKRKALKKVIGYYTRNRPYMHYHRYLAEGLPIGSGVVEGACRHLVKDRMELAGMRWVVPGAQAILDLRAIDINDDWESFMEFRARREQERLYGRKRKVG